MADGTSGPDAAARPSYGTIIVCGGGCYGGYYVRQLARARAAGAMAYRQLLVIDRDADCRVAQLVAAISAGDSALVRRHGWRLHRDDRAVDDAGADGNAADPAYEGLPVSFVAAEWDLFLGHRFATAIAEAAERADADADAAPDAVVPSPLMPNLLAGWVTSRVAVHRPRATISRVPVASLPDTPWKRGGDDGSHYASFATWMCPINCIEPPRCPETRGPRTWSMPIAVGAAADRAAAAGSAYDVIALFHTTHRAFGVGMFDVADAVRVDRGIRAAAGRPALRLLVASVSHCHGALAEVSATG